MLRHELTVDVGTQRVYVIVGPSALAITRPGPSHWEQDGKCGTSLVLRHEMAVDVQSVDRVDGVRRGQATDTTVMHRLQLIQVGR